MNYKEINGDLIQLANKGMFDVIAHGCNCMSNMGAGIAVQMNRAFDCSAFLLERSGPSIHKLGCIDYRTILLTKNEPWDTGIDMELVVVNAYTQYYPSVRTKPLDYEALTLCMRKMNHVFKGKHIGLPQIGAGLAGGSWERIRTIIIKELKDCEVTVVIYKK
jgi:O-acetyl-ADP-ribose deacetylase (regulator of RNase III)